MNPILQSCLIILVIYVHTYMYIYIYWYIFYNIIKDRKPLENIIEEIIHFAGTKPEANLVTGFDFLGSRGIAGRLDVHRKKCRNVPWVVFVLKIEMWKS